MHIVPYGLLLVTVFMPIEFLIFYMFEAQKADIIGALAIFPYTALMALLYKYLMHSSLWIAVFIIGIFTNAFCYMFSNKLYKCKIFQVRSAWMNVRQGPTSSRRHLFYLLKACGKRSEVGKTIKRSYIRGLSH